MVCFSAKNPLPSQQVFGSIAETGRGASVQRFLQKNIHLQWNIKKISNKINFAYSLIMKKLLFLIFITPIVLMGQEKVIPINLSLYNESTAIPFTRFLTIPIHLGLQVGTEFVYSSKERSQLFQTANVCYFYHNYLMQGIGINSELGYEYRMKSRFSLALLLGVGYMHTFATTEEFYFSNGTYQKKNDKGNARFYPSLSIDVRYFLKKNKNNSSQLFIRYQSWVEYPYSPDFIPAMTHINLHLGTKFFIHTKDHSK